MGKSFHCTLLRMILRGSKLFSACLDPVVVKQPTRRNSLKDQRPTNLHYLLGLCSRVAAGKAIWESIFPRFGMDNSTQSTVRGSFFLSLPLWIIERDEAISSAPSSGFCASMPSHMQLLGQLYVCLGGALSRLTPDVVAMFENWKERLVEFWNQCGTRHCMGLFRQFLHTVGSDSFVFSTTAF